MSASASMNSQSFNGLSCERRHGKFVYQVNFRMKSGAHNTTKIVAVFALIFSNIAYCQDVKTIESERDLGHGFKLVQMAQNSTIGFESVVHYSYLFFEARNLGGAGHPCISPSGLRAIFEESSSGILKLFSTRNGQLSDLTSKAVGIPAACIWNESENSVRVDFFNGRESRSFKFE